MKRAVALMLALVLAVGTLAGCGSGSSSSQASTGSQSEIESSSAAAVSDLAAKLEPVADEDLYIGISLTTMADEYMVTFAENFQNYADPRGIKYEIQGADSSAITQVSQIENMLTQGINVLFLWANEVESVKDVMKRAKDSGVYVIAGDDGMVAAGVADAEIGVSQYNYGYGATEMASDWINEKFPDAEDDSVEVVIFTNPSSSKFIDRQKALQDIETLNSKAKIVEEYNLAGETNLQTKCQEYADLLVANHPNVKVIICHSSSFALAIDEVLMRSPTIDPSEVSIYAVDYLEAAANSILASEEGKSCIRGFTMTDVENNADNQFHAATRELLPDENGRIEVGVKKVTIDNVVEVMEQQSA